MNKAIEILVTLNLTDEAADRIRSVSDNVSLTLVPTQTPDVITDEQWAKVHILYTDHVLPDAEKAPHLRWIQLQSAGVDFLMDHPLIQNRDIAITTMSGVITSQIAEYVLMAMLAFGQKLPRLNAFKQHHKWPEEADKEQVLLPIELRHSTVGIIGYGSIGRQAARLLRVFGTRVLAVKRDVMHPEDDGYTREGMGDPQGDYFDRLYPLAALHSVLAICNFVVLALPLTSETYHLMDAGAFGVMKDSAYLINVGRGDLVDESALITALNTSKIAGAALDVFHQEPLPPESPLWGMPQVIISPHIAGLSSHLGEDTLTLFINNLNRHLADLPLYNQVDIDRGY
jgi:phosphoglycerate dehydrogenase-like enzyme